MPGGEMSAFLLPRTGLGHSLRSPRGQETQRMDRALFPIAMTSAFTLVRARMRPHSTIPENQEPTHGNFHGYSHRQGSQGGFCKGARRNPPSPTSLFLRIIHTRSPRKPVMSPPLVSGISQLASKSLESWHLSVQPANRKAFPFRPVKLQQMTHYLCHGRYYSSRSFNGSLKATARKAPIPPRMPILLASIPTQKRNREAKEAKRNTPCSVSGRALIRNAGGQ